MQRKQEFSFEIIFIPSQKFQNFLLNTVGPEGVRQKLGEHQFHQFQICTINHLTQYLYCLAFVSILLNMNIYSQAKS